MSTQKKVRLERGSVERPEQPRSTPPSPPPGWKPRAAPPMPMSPHAHRTRRRWAIAAVVVPAVLVALGGALAMRATSTQARDVRAAPAPAVASAPPSQDTPPSRYALDKMVEALLWASDDDERFQFVLQDIRRVMGCAPVAWLRTQIDPRDRGTLEADRKRRQRFTARFDAAEGFLFGSARRTVGPHALERMSIAWRCADG